MDANDFTFGVEVETTIPRGLMPVGSYCRGRQARGLPDGWQAKSDSSIHAERGRTGCEFASPILRGSNGLKQVIEAVCKLNEMGATVNASTGVHVHVGWSGDSKALDRLVTLVANFECGIYAATGTKNRERGHWCQGLQRHGSAANARRNSESLRYHILNLTNLSTGRRPTVEFRAFSGSLNAIKIVSYIRLCLALVDRALKVSRRTNFTAKKPVTSSPIHRNGEGQTELTRLFYQLGWIRGRINYTYGWIDCDGAATLKQTKRELMSLARKYDKTL